MSLLNTLKPAAGAKQTGKRVGRGIGSGKGKTAGRGHKGQKARAGGYHKVGFEGGQMPLQRRLPKRGFKAPKAGTRVELRLHELGKVEAGVVDLAALKAAGLVPAQAQRVKVMVSGTLDKPVTVRGLALSKGARAAIEAAGGKVEEGGTREGNGTRDSGLGTRKDSKTASAEKKNKPTVDGSED